MPTLTGYSCYLSGETKFLPIVKEFRFELALTCYNDQYKIRTTFDGEEIGDLKKDYGSVFEEDEINDILNSLISKYITYLKKY
jgi:hypothetical protein